MQLLSEVPPSSVPALRIHAWRRVMVGLASEYDVFRQRRRHAHGIDAPAGAHVGHRDRRAGRLARWARPAAAAGASGLAHQHEQIAAVMDEAVNGLVNLESRPAPAGEMTGAGPGQSGVLLHEVRPRIEGDSPTARTSAFSGRIRPARWSPRATVLDDGKSRRPPRPVNG